MDTHFDKDGPEFDPEEQLTVSLGDPLLDMLAQPQADTPPSLRTFANIRPHRSSIPRLGKEKALR